MLTAEVLSAAAAEVAIFAHPNKGSTWDSCPCCPFLIRLLGFCFCHQFRDKNGYQQLYIQNHCTDPRLSCIHWNFDQISRNMEFQYWFLQQLLLQSNVLFLQFFILAPPIFTCKKFPQSCCFCRQLKYKFAQVICHSQKTLQLFL